MSEGAIMINTSLHSSGVYVLESRLKKVKKYDGEDIEYKGKIQCRHKAYKLEIYYHKGEMVESVILPASDIEKLLSLLSIPDNLARMHYDKDFIKKNDIY